VYDQHREKECDPNKDYSLKAAMENIKSGMGKKERPMGEWKKMRL